MNTSGIVTKKNDFQILPLPATIDEVIAHLEKIITWCEINNNCAGYFAVLYYKVTCKIKEGINAKDFEDGLRMEHLDVAFASRYLAAFYSWIAGKQATNSWQVAFNSVSGKTLLVLQHLLVGVNAHINLDLGVATVLVMHADPLAEIHNDFNTINTLLASMIDNMEDCLTKVNPLMKLLDLNIFKYDEMLVQFSISMARDGAWSFAQELNGKTGADYENCIRTRDERIAQLGSSIAKPHGFLLKFIVKLIRLFEKKNVSNIIKLLGG
ncbi:MAG: DUF5995 family protein [Ginsengibacter sp.]